MYNFGCGICTAGPTSHSCLSGWKIRQKLVHHLNQMVQLMNRCTELHHFCCVCTTLDAETAQLVHLHIRAEVGEKSGKNWFITWTRWRNSWAKSICPIFEVECTTFGALPAHLVNRFTRVNMCEISGKNWFITWTRWRNSLTAESICFIFAVYAQLWMRNVLSWSTLSSLSK
jgi:hypothetical protein